MLSCFGAQLQVPAGPGPGTLQQPVPPADRLAAPRQVRPAAPRHELQDSRAAAPALSVQPAGNDLDLRVGLTTRSQRG